MPIPEPGPGAVRVKVAACGICHSDGFIKEDTMNFCALTGVRPMIEVFKLEVAGRAYERMMTNQGRFRAVLVAG